jgi:hypothetical protein
MKTVGLRLSTPLPFWKILPNRPFAEATQRFDALAAQLIAQEKAKLADDAADVSGSASVIKDSCLLTQLVQCDASDTTAAGAGAATGEVSRNELTSEEVGTIVIPTITSSVLLLLSLRLLRQIYCGC